MDHFATLARSKKGSRELAYETTMVTVKYIKSLIRQNKLSPDDLIRTLTSIGRQITAVSPLQFAMTNPLKKIISLARYYAKRDKPDNLINVLSQEDFNGDELDVVGQRKKSEFEEVIEFEEALDVLLDEFDNIYDDISTILMPYINNDEVILTVGFSETILQCFIRAKNEGNAKFIVLVVNNNLKHDGPQMVERLTQNSIEAYSVEDACIYSIMHKVNKAIVNCYSLMADGGVLAYSGIYALAMVAKEHSVPVLVVTPMYKITPKYTFNQDTFNTFMEPETIFKRNEFEKEEDIDVILPKFDFIPSEYISLIISQVGEHTTSYIYRLFKDIYSKEEYLSEF